MKLDKCQLDDCHEGYRHWKREGRSAPPFAAVIENLEEEGATPLYLVSWYLTGYAELCRTAPGWATKGDGE